MQQDMQLHKSTAIVNYIWINLQQNSISCVHGEVPFEKSQEFGDSSDSHKDKKILV